MKLNNYCLLKKSVIYTMDAALTLMLAVIIIVSISGYLTRINYNKVSIMQPYEIGNDILSAMQRHGDINNFYLANECLMNMTCSDPVDSRPVSLALQMLPRQYNMVIELESRKNWTFYYYNNATAIIQSGKLPQPSISKNFIASGQRIVAINKSGEIIDFVIARFYIWGR